MTDAKVQDNNMECDNAGNEHEINVKKVSRWFFSRHRFVDFTEMFLVAGLNEQIWKMNNADKELMKLDYHSHCICSLETKGRQFDNFVATGGTVSCLNDNLRCHQWRQSCRIGDLSFSVLRFLILSHTFEPELRIWIAHRWLNAIIQ